MYPAPCKGHTILSGSWYHHSYFASETNKPANKTYSLRKLADPDYQKELGAGIQSKENHRQVYQYPHSVKRENNPAQGTEGGEEEKADPELAHAMLAGANSYGAVDAEGL